MNKIIKKVSIIILFIIAFIITANSKVFADANMIPADATFTPSTTTYKYDKTNNGYVTEYDFQQYAQSSYAIFSAMPADTYLYNRFAWMNTMEGYTTINQKYALCIGHGNTNRFASSTYNGNSVYKICTTLDITPKKISANGNGRVGVNAASSDVKSFHTNITNVTGNSASYIRVLSATAKYAFEHAGDSVTEDYNLYGVLNKWNSDFVKNELLDYSIGFSGTASRGFLDSYTKDGQTTYLDYADKVQNHKVENKSSISANADRKESTYNGTKYDYWGPFQIIRSNDIASITVTTSNAGSYKGIASTIGGQPQTASTSTIKSNTSFYVVTTTTTSTSQATITIKTTSTEDFYKARLMFFKHPATSGSGQNILVWRGQNTSISDTVTIKVTPSPKSGELVINKYNSDKSEKLAGAVFQLYDSNGNIVHFTGTPSASSTYTYTSSATINVNIRIPSSGTTTVKGLPAGTYTLKEKFAPTGYAIKTETVNVIITSGSTNTKNITNDKLGSLKITKVDSNNSNNKLVGAKFELYGNGGQVYFLKTAAGVYERCENGTSGAVSVLETNGSGVFTVSNLPAATYTLREIEAPVGYKLQTTNVTVTVTNNNTTEKTVTNNRKTGTLEIFKYDEKIGKGKPLAGGRFYISVLANAALNISSGTVQATKISAGVYSFTGIAQTQPTWLETNSNGKITIYGMPAEVEYTITEQTAPAGYERYEGNLYKIVETDSTVTVDVPESPQTIDLKILKKSATHPDEKYQGVGFKVICVGDTSSNVAKGWINANSNNEWNGSYCSFLNAKTFYTDSNGEVTVKGLPRNCKYEVYEVDLGDHPEFEPLTRIEIPCYASADGSTDSTYSNHDYAKKTNEVPTNAANIKATYTVSATNTENPGKLRIRKIDTSGEGRVNGIGFKIKGEGSNWLKFDTTTGKYLGTTSYYNQATLITTDSTGYTIQLNTIPIGTYHIYETDLGDYSSIYELEDELSVIKSMTAIETIKVKDFGTKTITAENTTVTVTAENSPVEGKVKIQKIDTSGKGRVNGIGFKIYDTGKAEWLQVTSTGEYTGSHTLFEAGTMLTTGSTGYTKTLTSIPAGTYNVYEVDLGSYSDLYSLTEDLTVHSYYQADGFKSIKVKNCGTFTIDKNNMSAEKLVQAENTPDEKLGSIKIKKIDTSTQDIVEGIGFKIFNYDTKEWLRCNTTTGKYIDTVENITNATELTTDSTGYTVTVTDVPPGNYLVFETNLGSHTEYPALESISIHGKNNTTISFNGKEIEPEETNIQYHTIKADEETNLEITAENTSTPTPESVVIKKTDKGTGNVVSGIGFKIYDETNSKWLQINTTTGDITGDTQDFEAATELITGSNGYTVVVKEVPQGRYSVYETNLGTNINIYKLGTVTVKDDGIDTEKTGKLIQTGNIGKTGKTITVKATNEQLGNLRIRKVDTSDGEKIVEGIGFKVFQYATNKWLQIDTSTGKVTGTTQSFDEATTIYTQNDGYTIKISDMPLEGSGNTRGGYVVYETDLGDNYEYELENINVPHNGSTKVAQAKRVGAARVTNTGAVVTVTAENTPITRIKLSGYVWKNGLNYGKTSTMDNVYDPNLAKDVKVSELTVGIIDNNGNVIDMALTDENGKYEFDNINVEDISNYKIAVMYDGIKYQALNNKSNGTNTNKFEESNRETFNQRYSTIKNDARLTYIKEPHASYLKNGISIYAYTDYLATDNGIVGTKTTGEAIANIAQIKSQGIKEITNINLGLYERTAPDLEVREYMYELVSTDKEDTDVDEENTWKLNRMHINSEILGKSDYSVSIWDGINNKVLTKTGNEAKKMYATYKIALTNASTGINNKVNTVTSYMNKNYSFVKAEIADSKHNNATAIANDKITVTNGKITLDNLDLDIKSQKTAYIYIEVEIPVDKLTQKLTTGGDTALPKNYTEISSYTSYVGENTPYAGVDKDSAPGNMNVELYDSTYEDDEGCSPNIWIRTKLNRSASASAAATDFIDKLISAKFSE